MGLFQLLVVTCLYGLSHAFQVKYNVCDYWYCPDGLVEPVCASNKVTYNNMCELERAQCYDKSIRLLHKEPCGGITECKNMEYDCEFMATFGQMLGYCNSDEWLSASCCKSCNAVRRCAVRFVEYKQPCFDKRCKHHEICVRDLTQCTSTCEPIHPEATGNNYSTIQSNEPKI